MSLFKQKVELEMAEAELLIQKNLGQFPPLIKWLVIIIVIGLLPAFYLTKKISSTYWQKKYQSFHLIGKPSFENPLELKINKVTVFFEDNNTYSALAEITNENLELAARQISFKFNFFNAQGQKITVLSGETQGETFILPSQTKYLISPKIVSTDKIVTSKLETTKKPLWQKRLNIPKVKLITTLPTFENITDPPAFVAEGYVQNSSPYRLKQVRLTFIVYNTSNQILAVSSRDEFDLKPYERRAYKQLWPNLRLNSVLNIKVTSETNVLDPSNLQLDTEPASPASDLDRPKTEEY